MAVRGRASLIYLSSEKSQMMSGDTSKMRQESDLSISPSGVAIESSCKAATS